jgi:CDP-diacylglycerol--serine O-phosphatidyltransferase
MKIDPRRRRARADAASPVNAAIARMPLDGPSSVMRLLPNALTTLALAAGMNAIRFAVQGRWKASVIAIVIAAVFDVLDGRAARLLNVQSRFGAELDSLSDVVCFGVAPALLLYLWSLNGAGNFGWLATLAFSICAALRLARFNAALSATSLRQAKAPFFVGVPTPAAAGLAILPVIGDFEIGPALSLYPYMVAIWTVGVALLMVSRIPTPSLAAIRVPPRLRLPLLAMIGILAGASVDMPWAALLCAGAAYMACVPILVLRQRRARSAAPGVEPASLESIGLGLDTDEADLTNPPPRH